jgi:alpha-tubulin suppressor-like RCC1 family protein
MRWAIVMILCACRGSSPPSPPTSIANDGSVATMAALDAAPAVPGNVSAIFAGGWRSCALRGGELLCWGNAAHGALGPDVALTQTTIPAKIPDVKNVVEVALGESHGCARTVSGEVWCWGGNEYGQRGDAAPADAPRPILVKLPAATQLAASGNHTCALAGGKPWCWGIDNAAPASLELAAIQVVAGDDHACALIKGGTVKCWGESTRLQLGTKRASSRPVAIAGLRDVDELAASGNFTCARSRGTVACWGEGENAQLGNLDRADSGKPLSIDKLADATRIVAGSRHACALRATGEVACWGGSDRGSFGFPRSCPPDRVATKGMPGPSGVLLSYCAAPTPVPGLRDVVALAHGADHACALDRAGAVRCWGGSGYGELGNRDHGAASSEEPVEVQFAAAAPTGTSAKAIDVAAAGDWSCAVVDGGSVKCWGAGSLGQLGPTVTEHSVTPIAIAGLAGIERVVLGPYHGCAIAAGAARCWGHNEKAALGDGTITKRSEPVAVAGVPKLDQLAASGSSVAGHSCALAKGRVWCWGSNDQGQALPGGKPKQLAPAAVPNVIGATQIALGEAATCAVVKAVPICWGAMPGDPNPTRLAKPTPIAGIDRVVELGMGYAASCARRDDGSVVCWGKRRSPGNHVVALGGKARSISVGTYAAAAILEDGSVMHWWIEQDDAPTKIDGLRDPAKVSCSGSHCCALGKAGEVSCWGGNQNGQLGSPSQGVGGESKRPLAVIL